MLMQNKDFKVKKLLKCLPITLDNKANKYKTNINYSINEYITASYK